MHFEREALDPVLPGVFRLFLPIGNDSFFPLPVLHLRVFGRPAIGYPIRLGILRSAARAAGKADDDFYVGFSGCPGGTPQDAQPNWITYRWPPEYAQMQDWQWKEKVIPYWKEAAKYARDHGIKRLAFEMHPNFVVYNPRTLMKLREAVG